jgi:hypothetical protein
MKTLSIGLAAAGVLLSLATSAAPVAAAGAYATNDDPSLMMICHDLTVAYRAMAAANQSSPSIAKAEALYRNAASGCKTNPREAIHELQAALHLVTPLQ